jgi:hypothetical protein
LELVDRSCYYKDTFAAAYAEAGEYQKAVQLQEEVLTDKEFVKREGALARKRLELYKGLCNGT